MQALRRRRSGPVTAHGGALQPVGPYHRHRRYPAGAHARESATLLRCTAASGIEWRVGGGRHRSGQGVGVGDPRASQAVHRGAPRHNSRYPNGGGRAQPMGGEPTGAATQLFPLSERAGPRSAVAGAGVSDGPKTAGDRGVGAPGLFAQGELRRFVGRAMTLAFALSENRVVPGRGVHGARRSCARRAKANPYSAGSSSASWLMKSAWNRPARSQIASATKNRAISDSP